MLTVDNVVGLLVMSALVFQAALGYYQHYFFLRDPPSTRRWFNYVHIWAGILLIVTGMFNGGSGLTLARVSEIYVNIWWSFSAILLLAYAIACFLKTFLAKRRGPQTVNVPLADSQLHDTPQAHFTRPKLSEQT